MKPTFANADAQCQAETQFGIDKDSNGPFFHLIMKMLRKKPEERPTALGVLVELCSIVESSWVQGVEAAGSTRIGDSFYNKMFSKSGLNNLYYGFH